MTPDMSRELAQLVGQTRARLTIFDRRRIWEAASGVDSLDQLPEDVRELLDRLRPALPREEES